MTQIFYLRLKVLDLVMSLFYTLIKQYFYRLQSFIWKHLQFGRFYLSSVSQLCNFVNSGGSRLEARWKRKLQYYKACVQFKI